MSFVGGYISSVIYQQCLDNGVLYPIKGVLFEDFMRLGRRTVLATSFGGCWKRCLKTLR